MHSILLVIILIYAHNIMLLIVSKDAVKSAHRGSGLTPGCRTLLCPCTKLSSVRVEDFSPPLLPAESREW